ncbi:MAG: flagellar export protein FliJ [Rhodocyclaceae bacterium]|nr:flagellar export protein FliJ [Rhodocyclaceae bacterium]
MPRRDFSLRVVQELSQFREEAAGREVGHAAARLAEGRQKAETLRDYRDHYARQLLEAGSGGVDAGRLRDALAFIARIDDALTQQAEEILRLEAAWQATLAVWEARACELRTYGVLEQRHLDRLAAAERRQEQKATDEWASRRRGVDG